MCLGDVDCASLLLFDMTRINPTYGPSTGVISGYVLSLNSTSKSSGTFMAAVVDRRVPQSAGATVVGRRAPQAAEVAVVGSCSPRAAKASVVDSWAPVTAEAAVVVLRALQLADATVTRRRVL